MSAMKTILNLAAAAILTLGAAVQAYASPLKAKQAMSIDVGGASGIAYYVAEGDIYDVVVTVSTGVVPMRFEAKLAAGQSVRFSTPASLGTTGKIIALTRNGDDMVVSTGDPALGL
jgi:hypothetical protein